MSSDIREDILVALEDCLNNVTGLTAYRNRDELPVDKLPAAVILDGREEMESMATNMRDARMPPALFQLWPQIWVALPPRDTQDNLTLNGIDAPIGPEMSHYRMLVINHVLNDPTLVSLLGPNGRVEYRGCETDMAIGSTVRGNLMLQFVIRYVFIPPR